MKWLADEIRVLRTLFLDDQVFLPPTERQLGLNGVIAAAVGETYRLPVLQLLTGWSLWSTEHGGYSSRAMTRYMYSLLLDIWLEKDVEGALVRPWRLNALGARFLKDAKSAVEASSDRQPWRIDLAWLERYMPDLSGADPDGFGDA